LQKLAIFDSSNNRLKTGRIYHGAGYNFSDIDLEQCAPNKDFGRAFYLTIDFGQALKWASGNQAKEKAAFKSKVYKPIVKVYEVDIVGLKSSNLKIKYFSEPNLEWANLILDCRTGKELDLDIVEGPYVDAKVGSIINEYRYGFKDRRTTLEKIIFEAEGHQIAFRTIESLRFLEWKEDK
jgi:hypothetical protein